MKTKSPKHGRLYAVLRKDRVTGEIHGYIEHSFVMDWSARKVRVWREYEFSHTFKEQNHKRLFDWMPKVDKSKYKLIFVRLKSKKSPITVDMNKGDGRKFDWRNKDFTTVSF